MARVRLSTTVDAALLESARAAPLDEPDEWGDLASSDALRGDGTPRSGAEGRIRDLCAALAVTVDC